MKKTISLFLGFLMILNPILNPICFAETKQETNDQEAKQVEESNSNNLNIQSKSAVLMEANTGKILYEYNSHEQYKPASVTKVMTILLAYEAIERGDASLEDVITISEHVSSFGGSTIFLETNEQIKFANIIKGMAVASGNDAAVATAEHIAGSESAFVELMNKRAKELGMNNTHFENACGLDADGHETSAYDIALMSKELIANHPEILEYTKIWNDSLTHQRKNGEEKTDLTNTNKLIKFYDGMTGLKTGYTSKAKYSISATAVRNDLSLIAVVMGAETKDIRTKDIVALLNYGFGNYQIIKDEKAGKVVSTIDVNKGKKNKVDCIVKDNLSILVKKNQSKQSELTTKLNIKEKIDAPITKGQKVGEIIYYMGEQEVGKGDVIVNESIEKLTLNSMLRKLFFMLI